MNTSSAFDTVVIKVGTEVITTSEGLLDLDVMRSIVGQIVELRHHVGRIVLVTSGAMACGRAELDVAMRDDETLHERQFLAFVGQVPLMEAYRQLFREHGIVIGAGLLTGQNFDKKSELKNIGDVFEEAFQRGVIPVCNENDLVATRELKLTDNDELAAHLARTIGAQCVLLLSTIPGIMTDIEDPSTVIPEVPAGSKMCEQHVRPTKSQKGSGGAQSKVRIGQELSEEHIQTTVANGRLPDVIRRVVVEHDRTVGTTFLPKES